MNCYGVGLWTLWTNGIISVCVLLYSQTNAIVEYLGLMIMHWT